MGNADAAWLQMDRPQNLMVINGVLTFDEQVDWSRLRDVLRDRLVEPFPRFRQRVCEPRLGLGSPQWEDDSAFDLDLHLHRVALPAPGDRVALQAFVGDRMAVPLDRARPLWEFYFVDGYGPGCAVVTRMHHAIADGIALARVLFSLTDAVPEPGVAGTEFAAEHTRWRAGCRHPARSAPRCPSAAGPPARPGTRASRRSRIRATRPRSRAPPGTTC